jgi:tetratricopeptide (TPR) repeat protein
MKLAWRRDAIVSVAVAIVTFALFAQTRHHDYIVYDDPQYVQQNDRVLRGLSWDNTRWAFTTTRMANWHPLAWMSHMLDVELFGPTPGPQHLVSVAIHAINAALVFLALSSLTRSAETEHGRDARATWCAALVAVLFAMHPLRMESVAWIAERKDLLCAMFFFTAIGCYGQYVRRQSWAWYGATLGAFLLGVLSKPMIVTFPFVLLLVDYWPLKRPVRLKLIWEKVPFFLTAIGASIITFIAQQRSGAMEPATYPIPMRIANAVWAYGRYLRKTFIPSDLAAFYPYYGVVRGTQFPWTSAAIAGVVLLIITTIAITAWRRERAVLIGWLWFLGVMVPTIGLVQVGSQSMADRYAYIPQVGLFIALIYGGAAVGDRWPSLRRLLVGMACLFAGILTISTAYQLRYWENSDTLFRHAMDVTHHNATANISIALYLTKDHPDDAIPYYEAALGISPGMSEGHSNLGALLGERGQMDTALDHLMQAVQLDPKYAEARNNLGNLLSRMGRVPQALHQYGEAIRLDPDSAKIHYNLAMTLSQAGRFDEAVRQFAEALRLRPDYPQAHFGNALALVASGKVEPGKREFERFLEMQPDAVDAMAQFAWALATNPNSSARDPQGAIGLAEHVNKLTLGERPEYLDTLAAAYASAGDFKRAIALATRARDLALKRNQADFADRIARRLELYQSGKPFVTFALPIPATNPENPRH